MEFNTAGYFNSLSMLAHEFKITGDSIVQLKMNNPNFSTLLDELKKPDPFWNAIVIVVKNETDTSFEFEYNRVNFLITLVKITSTKHDHIGISLLSIKSTPVGDSYKLGKITMETI